MHDGDRFDPEKLRLTPEQQATMAAAPKTKPKAERRQRAKFTMVPELWREQLSGIDAHGSTYAVALHLLHEAWRTDNRVVKLTNIALAKIGVSRRSKPRVLAQLRKAGLIAVEQRPGSNPLVTIRFRD